MTSDPHHSQPVLEAGAPLKEATGAVILLHGRGASADDILTLANEIYDPSFAYLAPEAASHAWYPKSFLAPIDENEPWLSSALKKVNELVERAVSAGVSLEKIVLAGFSQGACLATEFVARWPQRYGGLIAFTGGLIGPLGTQFQYKGTLNGMKAFLGSSDPDPHVPWARVKESATILSSLGADVTLRGYPGMPHTINSDEIKAARSIMETLTA
ncbi:MAG TPA: phospholipase [Candidatus Angelobacter sp.]|nr:phospholipase [Candidatus Angelobacter sp.]